MKILYVLPYLNKGGAEDVIINLANETSKYCDVSIFLFGRGRDDKYNISRLSEDVSVINLCSYEFKLHSLLERAYNKFLYLFAPLVSLYVYISFGLRRFDVIHYNMSLSSFYAPYFKLYSKIFFCKTKFLETFHTNWHLLKFFNKVIFFFSWNAADCVVCEIGKNEKLNVQKLKRGGGVEFIPFGVPPKENQDSDFLEKFRKEFSVSTSSAIFMSIARLRFMEKKFDLILQLMSELKRRGFSDFQYLICGDGPDRGEIEVMIEELGLSGNVVITGFVDRPQQVVYAADLFLVAMVEDFTGIAGLQAGMSDIPCLGVQTVGGYDGSKDAIFSSSDISSLSDMIFDIFGSEEKYELYREKSSRYVKDNFKLSGFYSSYKKLYASLVSLP